MTYTLTDDQLSDMRGDLDASPDVFEDDELNRLFDRAAGDFDVAIALAMRQLLMQPARFFNYTVGQTTIQRKQVFDNLRVILADKERIAGLGGGKLSAGTISLGIDFPDFSSLDEFYSDPLLWSGL